MSDLFSIDRVGSNPSGRGSKINWTSEQIDYILQHYAENHDIKLLADLFGVNQNSIRNLLQSKGSTLIDKRKTSNRKEKKKTKEKTITSKRRKCVCCGEEIGTDEESVPYKNRYAHVRCFNITVKTLQKNKAEKLKQEAKEQTTSKRKPKAELKDAVSEEEYAEKKRYYQYLHGLIDEDLSAKIYTVTDQYISRYNFNFKDMYRTLVYLHEILEKDLNGDIVGMIPYYYTEAIKYYDSVDRIEERNQNIDTSTMYQEKTIFIKPKQRRTIQIDINSIGKEEDNV